MPEKIEHRGFFATYDEIVDELITPAGILQASMEAGPANAVPINAMALWDTGAVGTCIQPQLKDRLNLRLHNTSRQLIGVGGNVTAYIALVNIYVTHSMIIQDHPVHIVEFPGNADILIGMDIIGMGDFVVCNADNTTSFSFVMPPFPDRINLADKAIAVNKRKEPRC